MLGTLRARHVFATKQAIDMQCCLSECALLLAFRLKRVRRCASWKACVDLRRWHSLKSFAASAFLLSLAESMQTQPASPKARHARAWSVQSCGPLACSFTLGFSCLNPLQQSLVLLWHQGLRQSGFWYGLMTLDQTCNFPICSSTDPCLGISATITVSKPCIFNPFANHAKG